MRNWRVGAQFGEIAEPGCALLEALGRQASTLTALSLKFESIDEECTKVLFDTITRISKLQHLALDFGAVEWLGENTTFPIGKGFTALTSLKLKAYVLARPVFRTFHVLAMGLAGPCTQLQV